MQWVIIEDTENTKALIDIRSYILCELDSNDKLITRCKYSVGTNQQVSRSVINMIRILPPDKYLWLETFSDTVAKESVSLINIARRGSDSVQTISSQKLGKDKYGIPYCFRNFNITSDGSIQILGTSGEKITYSPESNYTEYRIDTSFCKYIDETFDFLHNSLITVTDNAGNLYIFYPRHSTMWKYDKNDKLSVYDFSEYGNSSSICTFYKNRYIVFYSQKKDIFPPNTDSSFKHFYVFFDTWNSSIVEQPSIDDYMYKDIRSINVYPNPTRENSNIDIDFYHTNINNFSLNLFNSLGQKVMNLRDKAKINNLKCTVCLDTQGLPKGYYYLIFETERGSEYKGLIVY